MRDDDGIEGPTWVPVDPSDPVFVLSASRAVIPRRTFAHIQLVGSDVRFDSEAGHWVCSSPAEYSLDPMIIVNMAINGKFIRAEALPKDGSFPKMS